MNLSRAFWTRGLTLVTAVSPVAYPASNERQPQPAEGICVLVPTSGNQVTGTLSLLDEGDAVHVAGEVRHLMPGKHAFHIHELGDLRAPDASTCGSQYNPTHQPRESSTSTQHDLGDLGNIEADAKGIALVDFKVHHLKVANCCHAVDQDPLSQMLGSQLTRRVSVVGNSSANGDDRQLAAKR